MPDARSQMPDTRIHWKTVRCKNKYTSLCLENGIISNCTHCTTDRTEYTTDRNACTGDLAQSCQTRYERCNDSFKQQLHGYH